MKEPIDFIAKNRDGWNQRTPHHVNADFYDMAHFLAGNTSLKSIELGLLGEVQGKNILHLQCHFGQDTLSLARMGAKCTGIDLSDVAIAKARQLNEQLNLDTYFVCCNIYDLPQHLDQQFDIVFTSYGTIGWLPDLDKWASIIHRFLKPNGRFVFAEFHPVVHMYDADFSTIQYAYFKQDAFEEIDQGTYADQDAPITVTSVTWDHSLSEVFTALLKKGLQITQFQEFDYSPYPCFNHLEEVEKGKFQVKHFGNKIPMVYALEAIKVGG
ncbi:MAG: class I SAM-dependent methyltransferase [Chitinophagales bacterium]